MVDCLFLNLKIVMGVDGEFLDTKWRIEVIFDR